MRNEGAYLPLALQRSEVRSGEKQAQTGGGRSGAAKQAGFTSLKSSKPNRLKCLPPPAYPADERERKTRPPENDRGRIRNTITDTAERLERNATIERLETF